MIDAETTIADTGAGLPPILRAEWATASFGRAPWFTTIGPAFLGIFVWAPFFDSLWVSDLTHISLPWSMAAPILASVFCFGLLYFIPASWGFRTGRPLGIVAASTFGTTGSEWITGIAVGLVHILWYAVAIDFAVDSTLLGLRACGLIAGESLQSSDLGYFVLESPVYLCTAVFWIYITGTSAVWKITGVVVALMKVYSLAALVLLTAVALIILPNLGSFHLEDALKIAAAGDGARRWPGTGNLLQLVTGFFALAGLASVDWGARLGCKRDLVLGGFVGIVMAATWTALMSLVIVAGTVGAVRHQYAWWFSRHAVPLTFRWAIYHGIGGGPGGAILILFGLAALAPACYSAWVYSQKLSTHWPRLGQAGWTWIGAGIAFGLGATANAIRLDVVFFVSGLMFGPAVGAMAGDWLRQRGNWGGVHPGVNRAGLIAWGAGLGIALAVEIGRSDSLEPAPWWYSSTICAFVVSAACYLFLARMRRARQPLAVGPA